MLMYRLIRFREKVKEEMRGQVKDSDRYRRLKSMAYTLKVLVNQYYG